MNTNGHDILKWLFIGILYISMLPFFWIFITEYLEEKKKKQKK